MVKAKFGKGRGKDGGKPRFILPFDPEDELLAQATGLAMAYEEGKAERDAGEKRRAEASNQLKDVVGRAVATQGLDPEMVDGLECSGVLGNGKRFLFNRTVQNRKELSVQKLLELGVPAPWIELATVEKRVESWSVIQVKADGEDTE